MAVRIATNVAALWSLGDLAAHGRQMADASRHLATGLRIERASDDASGLALSQSLSGRITSLTQASSNAADAKSVAAIADGALATVGDILQRMRQLVLHAGNRGAIGADGLRAVADEVGALTELLDAIAEFTTSGPTRLLDGTYRGVFHIGAGGGDTVTLDLTGADTHAATFGGDTDLRSLAILGLNPDDGIYTVDGMRADLAALTKSITTVSENRSAIGAVENGLDAAIGGMTGSIANLTAARSTLVDADLATEAGRFTAARIQSLAAASVLAQANSAPAAVLKLLEPSAGSARHRGTGGSGGSAGSGGSRGSATGADADERGAGSGRSAGTGSTHGAQRTESRAAEGAEGPRPGSPSPQRRGNAHDDPADGVSIGRARGGETAAASVPTSAPTTHAPAAPPPEATPAPRHG